MRKLSLPKNKKHRLLSIVAISVIGVAIFTVSMVHFLGKPDVMADTTSTSVTISNALPVASATSIDSGAATISLTENTTTAVTCTATVSDNNGCGEIISGSAVLFRTNVAGGSSCAADDNDCYSATCTIDGGSCTGGTDLTSLYTCDFTVQYFADPTDTGSINSASDWTCEVTPVDGDGSGTVDTDTAEMATLTALDVTSSIGFGTLATGTDTGASNQTTIVTNTGNISIDSELSGTNMTCTAGSIPVANQKYGVSDVTYASLPNNLSGTPTSLVVDLSQRTSTVVTDDVFWGLSVPGSGVSGSCTGTNTFTAVTD